MTSSPTCGRFKSKNATVIRRITRDTFSKNPLLTGPTLCNDELEGIDGAMSLVIAENIELPHLTSYLAKSMVIMQRNLVGLGLENGDHRRYSSPSDLACIGNLTSRGLFQKSSGRGYFGTSVSCTLCNSISYRGVEEAAGW